MTCHKEISKFGQNIRRSVVLAATAISVFCISGYIARSSRPVTSNVPVTKFLSQAHDFASIMPLSKAKATFVSTNCLPDTLVIDRIDRSCGCTSASCNRTVVPPGQTFNLDTVLSAQDYPESMSSRITLYGHAGMRRIEAEYELHGDVENVIDFPESGAGYLRIGSWQLNQLPAQSTVMVTRGKYPLDFDGLQAECDSTALSASVEPLTADSWRIHFNVNSAGILGGSGYPVTFKFARQGKTLPESVVKQAFVELLGPVSASPSSLLLMATHGEHIQRTIIIGRRLSEPLEDAPQIVSAVSKSSDVTATWQNDTRQCLMTIDYKAPTTVGPNRGEIIVSVQDQGQSYKLKLSYLALVS